MAGTGLKHGLIGARQHPPLHLPVVPNIHVGYHPRHPYTWAFSSPYFHVHTRTHVETVGRPIRASK